MGRFQLELIYYNIFIFHRRPIQHLYVFYCKPFVVNIFSTPTRPVKNVLTTKGLQERIIQMLDGTMVENKGKTIN